VITNSNSDLTQMVGKALAMADELGLVEVALRLDQALIALTGAGIAPPADYVESRVTELL